jgi:CheY-like chemotaxis protein
MEAIGTLAGGIAHDFNNILSAIIGYAELAHMKSSDKSVQDHLEQVLKAGERAKNLVRQILSFSRCTGQEEQQLLDPASIFKEGLKLLRAFLPTTIEIRQNMQSGVRVMADPTQLHQVLMNLCTNAGHVMCDTGGVLTVELETVELDAGAIATHPNFKPGKYAQVRVGDTGSGIPPDVIDKIFNPFFTTKPHGEGTGLGLSVVHGIMKSHGGHITVASEIGKGTTFTMLLPFHDSVAETAPSVQEEVTPRGTERVLLVEDELSIAQMEKMMLEMLGYTVSMYTASIDGLDAFKHAPESFDIVVTDLTMPRMTGTEMVGLIRQVRPGMPVVVCTGYRNTVDEHVGDEDPRCRYVQKPTSMHDLGCAVRWVLDDKNPLKLLP